MLGTANSAPLPAPDDDDYALTPLGCTFIDGPMRALAEWVTQFGDELFEAQERTRMV
jgi:hypothetical protein